MERVAIDLEEFIVENLRLAPVPGMPALRLYTGHAASGLSRLGGASPYFAYPWAGGLGLALHLAKRPETVNGKLVVDVGCGGGVVAIAAAKGGARVLALDLDPHAVAAARLNAVANAVAVTIEQADALAGPPPEADVVTLGDLFYEPELAEQALAFAYRCADAGVEVLIGDRRRTHLPLPHLKLIAEYPVSDFGETREDIACGVFTLAPQRRTHAV